MKKLFLVLLFCLIITPIFAQYTVTAIQGNVQKEVRPNQWQAVTLNEVLNAQTVIQVPIGGRITIRHNSTSAVYSFPATSVGMIMDLIETAPRIRISGNVSTTDTSAARRTVGAVQTASARASDAAAEVEFEE